MAYTAHSPRLMWKQRKPLEKGSGYVDFPFIGPPTHTDNCRWRLSVQLLNHVRHKPGNRHGSLAHCYQFAAILHFYISPTDAVSLADSFISIHPLSGLMNT